MEALTDLTGEAEDALGLSLAVQGEAADRRDHRLTAQGDRITARLDELAPQRGEQAPQP